AGRSGLLNAPTGSGKTYAVWLPILAGYIENSPNYKLPQPAKLKALWLTPLRALARDIQHAMQNACNEMQIPWQIGCRTGDTTTAERAKQKKASPECLITTPESLHIMLSQTGYPNYFKELDVVVIDEWHELLGTKRGVQIELALSRIRAINPTIKVWAISATIGNLEEAIEVLAGSDVANTTIVKSDIEKEIFVETVIPEEIEKFPWAGHLGIKLLPRILEIIHSSNTTLLFTNTRSQTEIWYQYLLLQSPDLAGVIGMHHGSLDNIVRSWVEEALHSGKLKVVVCTSSLDLGVDFRPVDTVIQIGGPKGIARFLQRAGRSGHQPGAKSKIYFVPTNSMELIEGAALKEAIAKKIFESRRPLQMSMDVLLQYLVTLAVSEGFEGEKTYAEVKGTYAFRKITEEQFGWALDFITTGGRSLTQYEDFSKVEIEDGIFKVKSRRIAMRHRLSIGTIVGDPVLRVQYLSGANIGTVEESFITNLKPGNVFWFAGKNLEYVKIKELTIFVKKAGTKKGIIPRWYGGRMPLSSKLSEMIRLKLDQAKKGKATDEELIKLEPLFDIQRRWSIIPDPHELLIERFTSREGFHVFFFPFEGRYVHQVLASVVAYRIGKIKPSTFSIAMNDYGFELLCDEEIPLEDALEVDLFSLNNFMEDMRESINDGEMARRKFRDIASIAGLVFQGYPGKGISNKHLQASSALFFDVFTKYDPDNLLIKQSFEEVMTLQLEQSRLMEAMKRISAQKIILKDTVKSTPFAFPIMADRFRESMSNEKLEDRINKMQVSLEKYASGA
ncbi:MAG TPA: ligase-associated DNA damage response DEXH box helicase, partial [Cytophagaceae bacterium]